MNSQRRRNQPPSDDIPPVPEMPPIEALDLAPSGTGNTATTATATYPNVALSKRRSQAHINRESNSSGSGSSRRMYDRQHHQQQYYQDPRPVEPLNFGEPQQPDASPSTSMPRNFPTSLAEHTDRSERRWKQPPPQVTTSYSRLSPPTQGSTSPSEQTTSPTNFSSNLISSISKKSKHAAPILPMGTVKSSVFWREQEARDKLRMLCAPEENAENASGFDEIVEFGFPVDVQASSDEGGFGARQMTLHVTLSPSAMRDRDEVLYGWQKELATAGTNNNSNPTVDDVSTYQQSNYEDEKSRGQQPLLSGSTGTGGMKRVFGKLKKKAPANSSIMITSADVQ
ncbi:hypothetical protein CJU89_1925 [Yarrowia sp. B02]|nr:hypothetical protein CJU89_1925 [Yarrowia sp. B02]